MKRDIRFQKEREKIIRNLSGRETGGADREQCSADYGAETGRRQLPIPKSRGAGAESEYR